MTSHPHSSSGLKFRKLDLHSHTPASKCFSGTATPEDIVRQAIDAGLSGIAITDHNSGAWIDDVKAAAKGTSLTVFPGVEISCHGGKFGIHLIALFDPAQGTAEIESLLGNLELKPKDYGDIDTIVNKSAIDVAKIVHERGGLVVLAHANSSKGVLADMQGLQRTNLIKSKFVLAAEATDFQNDDKEKNRKRVVDLLDGSDPDYKRKLAVYQASDNPSGASDGQHGLVGIGSRCAYFKLEAINIEGLAQCFRDPDVRIRQDFEIQDFTYPKILKIEVNGGFLDGTEVEFHEGLNTVLGSKGAGKSLLIEFLRFAMNQSPQNPEIFADHESKLASRLDDYGSIKVLLADETGSNFEVTREFNLAEQHPYSDGGTLDIARLFPVLFLSQNEIIKIAENEKEQIAFIDRFLDFRSYQKRIKDSERDLVELDASLAESFKAYLDGHQLQQELGAIENEIGELDKKLKNPIFDKYSEFERKDRALKSQMMFIDESASSLGQFATHQESAEEPPELPKEFASDPANKRMRDVSVLVQDSIKSGLSDLVADVDKLKKQALTEYSKWKPSFDSVRAEYEKEVHSAGGDYKKLAQKRAQKMNELQTVSGRYNHFKAKSDRVADLNKERLNKLHELEVAYEEYSKERKQKCETIEKQSAGRLKVSIHEGTDKEEFRGRLMKLKRGSWLKEAEIEAITAKSSPNEFVEAIIRFNVYERVTDLQSLAKKIGIEESRMIALSAFMKDNVSLEELLSLQHQALPQDRPEIQYLTDEASGKYALLKDLSVGQKSTAMLIIALSDGEYPIVIDQPEDSLDIRSIWSDVCKKLRLGKERRQFIFTTHNSSLAVASDTDKFIVLEADANRARVTKTGAMDHSPVREDVVELLEGGPETYVQKAEKYRVEPDE